jgi:hypothetical protein
VAGHPRDRDWIDEHQQPLAVSVLRSGAAALRLKNGEGDEFRIWLSASSVALNSERGLGEREGSKLAVC